MTDQRPPGERDTHDQSAVERVIAARRSVRGFRPDRVPQETLDRVFAAAQRAPSNCNVQPWRVAVASGKVRDRVRDALVHAVTTGVPPDPDFQGGWGYEGIYRTHQVECAVALYSSMGIARDDGAGRARAALRNFELFDAPHVAFIGMDKRFGYGVAVDVGIYLQTLMLAMTAHGVASCPQGALRNHPHIVRDLLGVPEEIGILVGLSFGFEDTEVPANATRTTRATHDANVQFHG